MRAWAELYARAPSSYDWSRTHARRRGAQALRRLDQGESPAGGGGGRAGRGGGRPSPRRLRRMRPGGRREDLRPLWLGISAGAADCEGKGAMNTEQLRAGANVLGNAGTGPARAWRRLTDA